MRDKQDDCNHQQQMDRSERHVERVKSEQPQHQQNSSDSSEHGSSLIRSNFQTFPTIRSEEEIGYRGKPLMGGEAAVTSADTYIYTGLTNGRLGTPRVQVRIH